MLVFIFKQDHSEEVVRCGLHVQHTPAGISPPTSLILWIYDNPQLILFTHDILRSSYLEYTAHYLESIHLFLTRR